MHHGKIPAKMIEVSQKPLGTVKMGNGVDKNQYYLMKNVTIHRRSCRLDDEGILS